MTNGDKFMEVFGLYATELWAKPEDEFLEWLNTLTEPERETGKWFVDKYKVELTCSECKETFMNFPVIGWKPLWNFCPNCGAEMRGGNE